MANAHTDLRPASDADHRKSHWRAADLAARDDLRRMYRGMGPYLISVAA